MWETRFQGEAIPNTPANLEVQEGTPNKQAPTPPAIEKVLKLLADSNAQVRNDAIEVMASHWDHWGEKALHLLSELGESENRGVASSAQGAIARIRIRRRLGKNLMTLLPRADVVLLGNEPSVLLSLLKKGGEEWMVGRASSSSLDRLVTVVADGWKGIHSEDLLIMVRDTGASPYAPMLACLLQSETEPYQKVDLIDKLGYLGNKKVVPIVESHLEHSDPEVRFATLEALGRMGAKGSTRRILNHLHGRSWEEMVSASIALILLGATDVGEDIRSLLQEADTEQETLALISPVGWLRLDAAAPELKNNLASSNPRIRANAAEALGRMGALGAAEDIVLLLKDESPHVRERAVQALGFLGGPAPVDALLQLLGDADRSVQIATFETLGRLGHGGECVKVGQYIRSADTQMQLAAIRSSGVSRCERCVIVLLRCIRGEPPNIVREAVDSLVRIGDRGAIVELARELPYDDSSVSEAIVLALGRQKYDSNDELKQVRDRITITRDAGGIVRHLAGTIALLEIDGIYNSEGREALRRIMERSPVSSPRLRDAVSWVVAMKSNEDVSRSLGKKFVLNSAIRDTPDLVNLFDKRGIKLSLPHQSVFQGVLIPGKEVSLIWILQRLIDDWEWSKLGIRVKGNQVIIEKWESAIRKFLIEE